LDTSGVVVRRKEGRGNSFKLWAVEKLSENLLVEKFSLKMQHFGLKNPIYFKGKIKILNNL